MPWQKNCGAYRIFNMAHLKEAGSSMAHAGITILQRLHKEGRPTDALHGAPVLHNAAHKQQCQSHPQILNAKEA